VTRDQLIETMARAMCQAKCAFLAEFPCWDSAYDGETWPPSACDEPGCVAEATAALTAIEAAGMRVVPVEPSEKMKRAGIDAAPMVLIEKQPIGQRRRESWNTDECAEVYRAMILAAAQEDSTSE
jgi:hypothetical protein